MTYRATIKDVGNAKDVRVWLPVPKSSEAQKIADLHVVAPVKHQITKDKEYRNSILYVNVPSPGMDSFTVEMTFKVHRFEVVNRPDETRENGAPRDPLIQRFLMPDRLVPISGRIEKLSTEVAGAAIDPLEKARKIYDYTLANMKYDKSGTGWGRGDIFFACDEKRGNCTDFHAMAIGLARAQHIPAKFEIGFPIPSERGEGKIAGYHCWAFFYLPGSGWVPIDASEAWKNPSKREYFYGALDENRVALSVGRDIHLTPLQSGPPVNFLIYPYVEVDGAPHAAVDKEFSYRDLP